MGAAGLPRGMMGERGGAQAGQAPVFVSSQDSLDADRCFVQGLAPLYLQQSVLVILGWRKPARGCPHLPGARALSPQATGSHASPIPAPGRAGTGRRPQWTPRGL